MDTKRHIHSLLLLVLAGIPVTSCTPDDVYEEETSPTVSIEIDISGDKLSTRAPGDAGLSVNSILLLPFRKINESLADDAANFSPVYAAAKQMSVSSFPVYSTKLSLVAGTTYRIMVIGYNKNDYDFNNQSSATRRFDIGATDTPATLNGFYLKPVNPTDVPEFFSCIGSGYRSGSLVGASFRPEQIDQIKGTLQRIVSGFTLEINQIPEFVSSITLNAEQLVTAVQANSGAPLTWQTAGDNGVKSFGKQVPVSGKVTFNFFLLATTSIRKTLFYLDVKYGTTTERYTVKLADTPNVVSGNRIIFSPNQWVKVSGSYANINLGFTLAGVINLDDNAWDGIQADYFEVTFAPDARQTRAAVSGQDGRVRQLRYILYKSTGEYVKEKILVKTTDATPTWPLSAVKDTLPKGAYTAVFIANVEKTLFPYATSGGTAYAEVLTNYQNNFSDARIVLPNAEFTDASEYYWAKVAFSDTSANPTVLLQRIIGMLNLHRNFVDAQTALNTLVNNIVTQIGYKNIINSTVQGLLPGLVKKALDRGAAGNLLYSVVGGLDAAVNLVTGVLVEPVTNALYAQFLQGLVNQIGLALTGNATQAGALAGLGVLLNPWAQNEAHTAVVTIRNFPRSMDFSLKVKDYFTGDQRFKYTFTEGNKYDEKDILIKGFNGLFDVRKISVIKQGLVTGLLIDRTIDSALLLNGTFIDINDPIQVTVAANRQYQADYSFVDLQLKSYVLQTDGSHSLTLSVKLATISNIDGLLAGIPILGTSLDAVITGLIKNITVTLPVNLPLLGADNMTLSGSWSHS